ncbi:MAG TPA: SpoIID/LytB domain-containing protein, partial [Vicinamibacterales bacterium]|nr:SpoIID/LytB domain-containing protein [Vicinamibacterales bacterium]
LCDQTHCQVYRQPTAVTRRAAEATAGEVLFYDGAPASVFYSASCGGYTERPSEVWPGAVDEPYLPSKPDPACATLAGWSAALRASDLLRALHAAGFRGRRLHGIEAIARDASGRVTRLRLDGLQPDAISGQDLRVAVGGTLGWQYIKSTAFSVRRVGDGYQFDGRGSGHGVGLCVLGSVARARAGQSAADILQTYFPGTRLVNLSAAMTTAQTPAAAGPAVPTLSSPAAGSPAPAGIDVELTGDPQDRAEVQATALAARDDLARRLGVAAPAHLTIRVQPTLQAYEQATGRPWYTAGATRGDAVTLAPLATLRARGILARTIRRELVHVLTGGPLANRPLWVQDGVALFYADPRPPEAIRADADRLSGNCPRDAELRAPLSAGDLADAYARAEACVVRQIFKGKGWREIR